MGLIPLNCGGSGGSGQECMHPFPAQLGLKYCSSYNNRHEHSWLSSYFHLCAKYISVFCFSHKLINSDTYEASDSFQIAKEGGRKICIFNAMLCFLMIVRIRIVSSNQLQISCKIINLKKQMLKTQFFHVIHSRSKWYNHKKEEMTDWTWYESFPFP